MTYTQYLWQDQVLECCCLDWFGFLPCRVFIICVCVWSYSRHAAASHHPPTPLPRPSHPSDPPFSQDSPTPPLPPKNKNKNQVRDFALEVVRSPFFIAGNSIGGFTAMSVAADVKPLCQGLVLVNTAGRVVRACSVGSVSCVAVLLSFDPHHHHHHPLPPSADRQRTNERH